MTISRSKTHALLRRLAFSGMINSVGIAGLSILSAMATPAVAQEAKPDIQASTQIHKVTTSSSGAESFVATPVMGLDDIVQYTMDYNNTSEKALSNIQVTFKVPKDMRYVGGSLMPVPSHAKTLNDPEWKAYPVLEYVAGRPQEISANNYDAFAWTIARLEPKQTARVVLRAKLVQRPTTP